MSILNSADRWTKYEPFSAPLMIDIEGGIIQINSNPRVFQIGEVSTEHSDDVDITITTAIDDLGKFCIIEIYEYKGLGVHANYSVIKFVYQNISIKFKFKNNDCNREK
jgi:hypothetical protein